MSRSNSSSRSDIKRRKDKSKKHRRRSSSVSRSGSRDRKREKQRRDKRRKETSRDKSQGRSDRSRERLARKDKKRKRSEDRARSKSREKPAAKVELPAKPPTMVFDKLEGKDLSENESELKHQKSGSLNKVVSSDQNAQISFDLFEDPEPKTEQENNSVSNPTPINVILNEGNFHSESQTEKAESEFKAPKRNEPVSQVEKESSMDEMYDEELPADMAAILGFTDFASSKGKDHSRSAVEGIFKNKKNAMKPRQYMNRRGGFNKPLDKV